VKQFLDKKTLKNEELEQFLKTDETKAALSPFTAAQMANRRMLAYWLFLVLAMLLAIVLVGGATRMTGSGLSITEWKPIHGVIPPIGEAQWAEEFEKYQQIAQYEQINQGMVLSEFKFIFWWEWAHRLLARLVGMVLILILAVFSWQKRLEKPVGWSLFGILVLIGVQGAIGWWMVHSGLGDSNLTYVSQYRLAIHLVAASLTIIAVTCLICSLLQIKSPSIPKNHKGKPNYYAAGVLVFLILFQIYLGALVAGIHAGNAYNSWPLMDGQWIPDGLFVLKPLWLNFFENSLTVQFIHRFFAYLLLLVAIFHTVMLTRSESKEMDLLTEPARSKTTLASMSAQARRSRLLLVLITVQAIFGIVTLLTLVPIEWGLIHQAMALIVLCFASAHWQYSRP